MLRTDLRDCRPWLIASLAASTSYFFLRDLGIPGAPEVLWKGAGVGCLAVYAARRARGANRWPLVAVMAVGALSDMVLEANLLAGGALFAVAHCLAIALYLHNPRNDRSAIQMLTAAALLIGTPLIAALLTIPDPQWPFAAIYSLFVGAMAARAWVGGFSRVRVGVGAVLFVISDLLIFAREGQRLPEALTLWTIWPIYYVGQFMIATGVATEQSPRRVTFG